MISFSNQTLLIYVHSYKGNSRIYHEACCETWSVKMRFAHLFLREISLGPSSDWIRKCMAVNKTQTLPSLVKTMAKTLKMMMASLS